MRNRNTILPLAALTLLAAPAVASEEAGVNTSLDVDHPLEHLEEDAHGAHSYYVFLPLFTIVIAGYCFQLLTSRVLQMLPYTLPLSLFGIVLGIM